MDIDKQRDGRLSPHGPFAPPYPIQSLRLNVKGHRELLTSNANSAGILELCMHRKKYSRTSMARTPSGP